MPAVLVAVLVSPAIYTGNPDKTSNNFKKIKNRSNSLWMAGKTSFAFIQEELMTRILHKNKQKGTTVS